jgi:hypothetical protein
MALIDLSNYATTLVQDKTGLGTNGNVYFDTAAGTVQFFTVETVPTFIITDTLHPSYTDGTSPFTNPLVLQDGLKFEAIYAFENQERRLDEILRAYDRWTSGTFKFGGAYNFINSKKPLADADRQLIRGSGWNEYASDGAVDRIYFGNKGLSNIEATSAPYYQLAEFGVVTPYAKVGQIDEAVQVFGSTANVPADASAGDFDTRTYEAVSVRTYGYNHDRKITTTDLGITELGGYSTGFAVNESLHLTTSEANMPIASVYNADPSLQTGVWLNMVLTQLDVPQVETGFTTADGSYTWVLSNPSGATLAECVAYLDAIATVDADINAHLTNVTDGKKVNTWYTYSGAGKIVTKSGTIDGKGLFISGLVGTDKQAVVLTDDLGVGKVYPFYVSVQTNVGAGAVADTLAWFHNYFSAAYNTASAITVQDKGTNLIKGNVAVPSTGVVLGGSTLTYEFDYATGGGGTGGVDQGSVMVVEGDGGVTQAKTLFTLQELATISVTCSPGTENNV